MDRLDAASPPTSPADAIGVAVRYTKLIAIGPGQLTAGNQVDQRIILVPEKLQDAGNRPVKSGFHLAATVTSAVEATSTAADNLRYITEEAERGVHPRAAS